HCSGTQMKPSPGAAVEGISGLRPAWRAAVMFSIHAYSRLARLAGLAALLAGAALVAGCAAPSVSARVTSFQQWPDGVAGQTYQFAPETGQRNNLEYQSYQDMVRAGIGATGLVEAREGRNARFTVSFRYG